MDARRMRARMRVNLVQLQERVRRILFEVWDPIGADGLPPDEYDEYVRPIRSMIVNSRERTLDEFAEFLSRSERDLIGMCPDPSRIHRTTELLKALRSEVHSSWLRREAGC